MASKHPTTEQTQATLQALQQALRAVADPAEAVPMRAYMLDQFAFFGIRAPARREAVKHLLRGNFTEADVLDLAEALWVCPEREFRYTAVDLLAKHHKRLSPSALPRLLQLVQQDAWWDTVDGLAGVVGDILRAARSTQADIQTLADGWLQHDNLWVRRVAMLHQLGWREATDAQRLMRYALTLAHEKDFFIRKAIGWALRDYARTAPEAVRAFLQTHAKVLSPLTVREAGKHLQS